MQKFKILEKKIFFLFFLYSNISSVDKENEYKNQKMNIVLIEIKLKRIIIIFIRFLFIFYFNVAEY